jgi:hypothetical protein
MSVIKIGDRLVGDGQPTYIIAEIGVNHNGFLDLALKLIDVAVDAGADAVKFQKRKLDKLYAKKYLENANAGLSLGRLDQLLYDLYRRDVEAGRLTVSDAVQWVAHLWLKLGDHVPAIPAAGEQLFGGTGSNQAITLGGVDALQDAIAHRHRAPRRRHLGDGGARGAAPDRRRGGGALAACDNTSLHPMGDSLGSSRDAPLAFAPSVAERRRGAGGTGFPRPSTLPSLPLRRSLS